MTAQSRTLLFPQSSLYTQPVTTAILLEKEKKDLRRDALTRLKLQLDWEDIGTFLCAQSRKGKKPMTVCNDRQLLS